MIPVASKILRNPAARRPRLGGLGSSSLVRPLSSTSGDDRRANKRARKIIDFVSARFPEVRVGEQYVNLKECPYCEKPTNGDPSNEYVCGVNTRTGAV